MRRFLSSAIAFLLNCLLLAVIPVSVSAETFGYYDYIVSGGTAKITDCDTYISGDVTIPSSLGGGIVRNIGAWAFQDCTRLTTLTLPDCVYTIGDYAFLRCENLTSVNFGEGIKIGACAFYGCSSLERITLSGYIDTIGSGAFRHCTALREVYFVGDPREASQITVYSQNEALQNATWYFEIDRPAVLSVSDTSLTLVNDTYFEYSMDGFTWQDSPTFSGLTQNKQYQFYQRLKATANIPCSAASQPLEITFSPLKIYYDANGGNGAPEPQFVFPSQSVTLSANAPTRNGFEFVGWGTKKDGEKQYAPSETVTPEKDITLYALWLERCETCKGTGKVTVSSPCTYRECKSGYVTVRKCNYCGSTKVMQYVGGGTSGYICNDCSYLYSTATRTKCPYCNGTTVVDKKTNCPDCSTCKTHNFGTWTTTDNSNHSRICSICNYVEKASHNWDNGSTKSYATCKNAGEKVYTCNTCYSTKTELIDKLTTHTYDNDCDKTCNICGTTRTITHEYQTSWSKDKTGHWHECSLCGDKKDVDNHWSDPGAEATETSALTCYTCGYIIKPALNHKHDYAIRWTIDRNGHWHACSGCEEYENYAEHDFENACDPDCSICGFTRKTAHSYTEKWCNDEISHWYECTLCKDLKDLAPHVSGAEATDTTAQICIICEYILKPALNHQHDYEKMWTCNETSHWHACSGCNLKDSEAAHEPGTKAAGTTEQICTVCGYRIVTVPSGETIDIADTASNAISDKHVDRVNSRSLLLILIAAAIVISGSIASVLIVRIVRKKKD